MDYLTRVRNLRNDSGYSQEYVGNVLHVSQRTYAEYELGKIKFPLDAMIRLAKLYDVDMNYICGLTEVRCEYPCDNPCQVSKK